MVLLTYARSIHQLGDKTVHPWLEAKLCTRSCAWSVIPRTRKVTGGFDQDTRSGNKGETGLFRAAFDHERGITGRGGMRG